MFGPQTQLTVAYQDGHRVARALQDAQSGNLVLKKACTGWTVTTHLSNQAHSSVQSVGRRTWLKLQTSKNHACHMMLVCTLKSFRTVALDHGEVQRDTRAKHDPSTVSQREFDLHHVSHLPFRSKCDHCVRGTAREDAHPSRHDPRNDPQVGMDYFFLGRGTGNARAKPML